jgi:PEP-CTERM motif
MIRRLMPLLGLLGLLAGPSWLVAPARSDVLLYSNIANSTGFASANGGAANVGGNNITTLKADDITPGAGLSGGTVDSFTFTVANLNAVAVVARPRVRFYSPDGAGTGPGTLITGFTFNPISFAAGVVSPFTFSSGGATLFSIPTGSFWAGVTFDDNGGTTGATLAQLNKLGQGIFNPPTLGSSQDVYFQTSSAGSFLGNNPAGGFFSFGGSPVASFGWAFSGTPGVTSVPEPSSLLLLGIAGVLLAGGATAGRWGNCPQTAGCLIARKHADCPAVRPGHRPAGTNLRM